MKTMYKAKFFYQEIEEVLIIRTTVNQVVFMGGFKNEQECREHKECDRHVYCDTFELAKSKLVIYANNKYKQAYNTMLENQKDLIYVESITPKNPVI